MPNSISKVSGFKSLKYIAISGVALFAIGACATKEKHPVKSWDEAASRDYPQPPTPPAPPAPPVPYEKPPKPPINQAEYRDYSFDKTTRFAGCTGSYTLSDATNGKIIGTGRAFNDYAGLYVIDKNGKRTGKIINSGRNQTIYFKPDDKCTNYDNSYKKHKY